MSKKTLLEVGDVVVRTKGYEPLIGRRYRVLSITLTDTYIQDIVSGRCVNYPNSWLLESFVKILKTEGGSEHVQMVMEGN